MIKVLAILIAYLLGSIPVSVLVSKLIHKDDIRRHGSGNPGASNMTRTFGLKSGALTLKMCIRDRDEIDAMVSDIEREVYNSLIKEISSARIGDLVMEKLRGKDDVAYVRFASVYKQFKDIDEFMDELRDLVKERSS